jgi:dihydroorotase
MSHTPARIGRVERGAPVQTGSRADLTLYDPSASSVFGVDRLAGKGVNSPYLGRELPGRVAWTFHDGRAILRDGRLIAIEEAAELARSGDHDPEAAVHG